jgi:hypothetical protein
MNKLFTILALSSLVFLTGCNNKSSSQVISDPWGDVRPVSEDDIIMWDTGVAGGKEGYVIKCGLAHPGHCYADAAESCPKGYEEKSFNPGNLETPMPHILVVTCKK